MTFAQTTVPRRIAQTGMPPCSIKSQHFNVVVVSFCINSRQGTQMSKLNRKSTFTRNLSQGDQKTNKKTRWSMSVWNWQDVSCLATQYQCLHDMINSSSEISEAGVVLPEWLVVLQLYGWEYLEVWGNGCARCHFTQRLVSYLAGALSPVNHIGLH